ncbi:hypothetical protein TrRE_jg3254 [Triparma retinervis]|uniref:Uncharacterized protein n=1 Tax=Triparma retinervis TaxID=2557542 RepID=A0A9W7DL79_9STRA|nr:hypothetical protein TrRE_jg3254 [Triparma retinervis]
MAVDITSVFLSALKSIATVITLASGGFYLSYRGRLPSEVRKGFARVSQGLTIPCLLFTSVLACNQDWSDDECPSVTAALQHGWVLLLYPIVVVGTGLLVGEVICRALKVKEGLRPVILASVAFGNTTGLPITLLTTIHKSFPSSTELGNIDPIIFLSVYLLVYPILQWGVGTTLLKPEEEKEGGGSGVGLNREMDLPPTTAPSSPLLPSSSSCPPDRTFLKDVMEKAMQAPVIASLFGFLFALVPFLRGVVVDINDRDDDAPLEAFYNGLYGLGQAAVPINMIVLGGSLHQTWKKTNKEGADGRGGGGEFTPGLAVCCIIGKMVIVPAMGVCYCLLLRQFLYVPDDIDASFYLVFLMVTVTPTANNVMTMAVQAGKEDVMARLLFYQYVAAPVILCASVGFIVALASTF